MNLYPARIEELHSFIESTYGQMDRQATEILLARLLKSPWRSPWLILETDYPSRDPLHAWFSFGETGYPTVESDDGRSPAMAPGGMIRSLSVPRVERAYKCEEIVHQWLYWDGPAMFIESEWRRLPPDMNELARSPRGSGRRFVLANEYRALMAKCIRLRVDYPRGSSGLRDRHRDDSELRRLVARVLDNSLGRPPAPGSLASLAPPSFLYWCELAQRLMPFNTDWDTLTSSIAGIAVSIGRLYDDGRGPDWAAAERLLRDGIHWATTWIMSETSTGRAEGRKALKRFQAAGHTMDDAFKGEIRRLNRLGVILVRQNYGNASFAYHPWRYRLASGDWARLIDRSKRLFT